MDDRMFGEARAKGMVGEASPVFDEVASIAGEIRENRIRSRRVSAERGR